MKSRLERLALLVEIVTDIVMGSDGVATSKGTHALGEDDGHELESETAWHFGFYSRPKDGARGVVLKADGKGNTSFLFCFRDKQYELSLEKGEVGAKNAFDAYWLLNKDGVLELNGTAYKAVIDTLVADLKNWVTAVNAVLASNCVNGSTLTAYSTQSSALAAFATSIGPSTAYRSAKVKLG